MFNESSEMIEDFPNKKDEKLYSTTAGIREYAISKGTNTEALIEGTILQATNKLLEVAKEDIKEGKSQREILEKYAGKVVSEVTKEHMSSGLSIPRVFFGGNYNLEDVISAASCIDAATFNKVILEEGFGMICTIHTTRLGVVPNHHYVEIDSTNQVIDPIVGRKENPGGFFKSKKLFERVMDIINTGGTKLIVKQVKNMIFPEREEPSQVRAPNAEAISTMA